MSVLFGLDKLEPRKFIIVIAISFGGEQGLPLPGSYPSLILLRNS